MTPAERDTVIRALELAQNFTRIPPDKKVFADALAIMRRDASDAAAVAIKPRFTGVMPDKFWRLQESGRQIHWSDCGG